VFAADRQQKLPLPPGNGRFCRFYSDCRNYNQTGYAKSG